MMNDTDATALFSIAAFPSVSWFLSLKNEPLIWIEACENYQRQSYRNRYRIVGPNGLQTLSIPVINNHGEKTLVRDIRIDFHEAWQRKHWRSITTAYSNSPYFLYLEDEFEIYFKKRYEFLFDFNIEIIQKILKLLKLKTKISLTEKFVPLDTVEKDYRYSIHPKLPSLKTTEPYRQVFSEKMGFYPDLSIIDYLFNCGLNEF